MAKTAARMDWSDHSLFWEILPDIVPDLTIHMPALTAAVRAGIRRDKGKGIQSRPVLRVLSSHPLPTTLPPETMGGRQGLVNVWEEQLKLARKTLDIRNQDGQMEKEWEWKRRYIFSLRGLTQVDRCDLPPGMTCPSVLPTLLGEVHAQRFRAFEPLEELYCLAFLSDWRPGRNVLTDPTVLNEWVSFWLGLYHHHQGSPAGVSAGEEALRIQIIKKGIAAKGLLNLMETGREKETVVPAGLETALLKSLTMAAETVGENPNHIYDLDWLSWQPRDVTRFPTDRLVQVPETLLKIFTLSCRNTHEPTSDRQGKIRGDSLLEIRRWHWDGRKIRQDSLTKLVRWDRAGLSAACGIDLLPAIVTGMNNYLNTLRDIDYFRSTCLLNHEVCRWLAREEVANVEGGRELLQKLGRYWESESMSPYWDLDSLNRRIIAWKGRIQLQQAGLATETPDVFHNDLLKAIKKEDVAVRLVLYLWRPGKDTPDRVRRKWERLLEKKLKSDDGAIVLTAVQAFVQSFLGPDPANDPVARWQKLRSILPVLPEPVRLELSVTEIMHLMGELPVGNPNVDSTAAPNRRWQFRPDEMRFRVPTEPVASVSTASTVQPAAPDRRAQGTAERVQSGGCHG